MSYQARQRRRTFLNRLLAFSAAVVLLLVVGGWLWQQVLRPTQITPLQPIPGLSPTPEVFAEPTALLEQIPQDNSIPLALDDVSLQQTMLAAINQDRQNNGLQPVTWDATAAYAGTLHAADMAANNYFSHWNMTGYGPEYRYNQAGGHDTVMENIFTYSYTFDDGHPAPIADFMPIVQQAQEHLMNSPGHRANILTPEHTHVGVGFAYNPETGSFYLAQEFVNRYVAMQPLPLRADLGSTLSITGALSPGVDSPTINLTYQPFPAPLSIDELNTTSSYQREVDIYQAISPDMLPDGTFQAQALVDYQGQVGLYSVRVWVTVQGETVLASEWLVEVE